MCLIMKWILKYVMVRDICTFDYKFLFRPGLLTWWREGEGERIGIGIIVVLFVCVFEYLFVPHIGAISATVNDLFGGICCPHIGGTIVVITFGYLNWYCSYYCFNCRAELTSRTVAVATTINIENKSALFAPRATEFETKRKRKGNSWLIWFWFYICVLWFI